MPSASAHDTQVRPMPPKQRQHLACSGCTATCRTDTQMATSHLSDSEAYPYLHPSLPATHARTIQLLVPQTVQAKGNTIDHQQ